MSCYPWQAAQWRTLTERARQDRLPHALLLCGREGLGKAEFARHFAHALLCEAPDQAFEPCGQCRSCLLYKAGNHPDLTWVAPEEGKTTIAIDQIRELSRYLALTSHVGKYRIAIVAPAERLTTASANGLLKTLEEPGPRTLIMLIGSEPHKLLATIRSRCQKVAFTLADRPGAINWLRSRLDSQQSPELLLDLAGNAPLRALALAADDLLGARRQLWQHLVQLMDGRSTPVTVAEQTQKQGARPALGLLWGWVADMIRCRSGEPGDNVVSRDMLGELGRLAMQAELAKLHAMLEKLTNAVRLADTQVNEQLLLEDIFITWKGLFRV